MALNGKFADPQTNLTEKPPQPLPKYYVATPPVSDAAALSKYSTETEESPNKGVTKGFVQQVRVAETGVAARPATTFNAIFRAACAKGGDNIALAVERPADGFQSAEALPLEQWTQWTWTQYQEDAERAAAAFMHLGVDRHDSVGVWGFNAPEWHLSCVAGILLGSPPAGIYPTDTPDQVVFKLDHSDSKVVVLEDNGKLNKLTKVIDRLPLLKAIIMYGEKPASQDPIVRQDGSSVAVLHWSEVMAQGQDQLDNGARDQLVAREADIQAGSCAVLVYTSGTTGNPKAVMTSHDNVLYEAAATLAHNPEIGIEGQDRLISYLPLSHVAGFLLDVVIPSFSTASSPGYFTVFFARPNDLKDGTIGKRLVFVKPTFFFGVPRVWEKMQEKMMAVGASTKGLKKKIATWAKAKGLKAAQRSQLTAESADSSIKVPFAYGLAEKLVLSKVKMALGLEHCKSAATGAAPITVDTLEYFGKLGLQINEVYGMSESTGLTTVSTNASHVWGSCGFPICGSEVKVFRVSDTDLNDKTECPRAADGANAKEEEQGEICFRGRGIMNGYLANPRYGEEHMEEMAKKTADAIDADGWMHSGDKGCQDRFGMVKITGRYKELIIGAGGENIAPVPIEDTIKHNAPALSNVMMVGDKRKFNTCVVTLMAKGATGELPGGDELTGPALLVNPAVKTVSEAQKDPVWLKYVEGAIRAANLSPACPSNAAKIQKFRILARDFSVQTDEFTPTFKLKRSVVCKIHAATIDEMYED